jgi:hypothetical protein
MSHKMGVYYNCEKCTLLDCQLEVNIILNLPYLMNIRFQVDTKHNYDIFLFKALIIP